MQIIIRCKCALNLLEIDSAEVTKYGLEIVVDECSSCAEKRAAQQQRAPDVCQTCDGLGGGAPTLGEPDGVMVCPECGTRR